MSGHSSARIDAHQHFWRYDAAEYSWIDESMSALRRDFLPPDLAREMPGAGVDACVAVQARHSLDETGWLLGLADAHPFIAGVVGWVDLQAADLRAQLNALCRHHKLVGIRHIAQSEPDDWFLVRPAFVRGVAMLAECGLAYDMLVYRRQLPAAAELAALLPHQRFVLDHLGKPEITAREVATWHRDLRAVASHENVCAKLSGLVTEADWQHWTAADIRPYLDIAFDCFGPERLMIGSDWPVCTLAADYQRTMAVVVEYLDDRPLHERDAVLGGNAAKFWNLRVPVTHA
jgi:L-fucono-1,5-lactonase